MRTVRLSCLLLSLGFILLAASVTVYSQEIIPADVRPTRSEKDQQRENLFSRTQHGAKKGARDGATKCQSQGENEFCFHSDVAC